LIVRMGRSGLEENVIMESAMGQAAIGKDGGASPETESGLDEVETVVLKVVLAVGRPMTIGAITAETLLSPAVVTRALGSLLYKHRVAPAAEPQHDGLEVRAVIG
jgi:hypothetical protein